MELFKGLWMIFSAWCEFTWYLIKGMARAIKEGIRGN